MTRGAVDCGPPRKRVEMPPDPNVRAPALYPTRSSWLSLLLLYLAVGLLAWGLVAAVAEDRSEQKRLEEGLLRLSERNSKLSERVRFLESKLERQR
jgi:hypothetical protein